MPAPEHRTRWDLIAAAVLVAAVLGVSTVLWWISDARKTNLVTATGPPPQPPAITQLPLTLTEAWRAASPATTAPLVQGGTVVTGTENTVTGRDLRTGSVRWSYQRDRPLCTVAAAFRHAVAVYQRGNSCGEVTALDWSSGRRTAQRTGPVEAPTRLAAAGNQVAASGQHYLEVWRPDLVRTLAYGRLPTPAQPATQPRPDCVHGSMAMSSGSGYGGRLAVVEHCAGERARLTVQRSDPKEPDQPEVLFSVLLPGWQARVVALSDDRVAAALPNPARLVVLDGQGKTVAEYPLTVPDTDLRGDPAGGVVDVTKTPSQWYWFTGSATVALDAGGLQPQWTRSGCLGPGAEVAGRLLLPVPGALAVLDATTGEQVSALPVNRGGYRGPIGTASSGAVILEQRGATLVALH
jgi:hypothetical protein